MSVFSATYAWRVLRTNPQQDLQRPDTRGMFAYSGSRGAASANTYLWTTRFWPRTAQVGVFCPHGQGGGGAKRSSDGEDGSGSRTVTSRIRDWARRATKYRKCVAW